MFFLFTVLIRLSRLMLLMASLITGLLSLGPRGAKQTGQQRGVIGCAINAKAIQPAARHLNLKTLKTANTAKGENCEFNHGHHRQRN
jgi:hypothetical protein